MGSTQLLGKAKYHRTMSPVVTFTLLLSVIMVLVTASPVREGESDGSWHVCVPHNSPGCAFVNSAALRGKRSTDSDKGLGGKNRWYQNQNQWSFGKPDASLTQKSLKSKKFDERGRRRDGTRANPVIMKLNYILSFRWSMGAGRNDK